MERLGQNTSLYHTMLYRLEKLTMRSCLSTIKDAITEKNWSNLQSSARLLKDSGGYVGACKIHYACYYIEREYHRGDFDSMLQYYPLLVEACMEYRHFYPLLIP